MALIVLYIYIHIYMYMFIYIFIYTLCYSSCHWSKSENYNRILVYISEHGIEWDRPSTTQVLPSMNKNRVKGPSKALPGKYSQVKVSF